MTYEGLKNSDRNAVKRAALIVLSHEVDGNDAKTHLVRDPGVRTSVDMAVAVATGQVSEGDYKRMLENYE